MSGLLAIVGRPNVGKSALFNRIVGKRIAIVHDQPGVTRDRISAEAEWHGKSFTLVDTGGLGMARHEDMITHAAHEQVNLAIEMASAIIFVVNVQEGIVPLDLEVASLLRKSGKPILLAVNKVDSSKADLGVDEFSKLGFNLYPVSAIHERGVTDLMDAALKFLPVDSDTRDKEKTESTPALKIAIVGRPNVGKSSIINALTKSDRVIVTSIAGTTRDSVDVPFEVETEGVRQKYILIDTAGVRQERRIDDSIEFYSVKRTEESIARSDLVVFVLDAEAGVSAQDKKVAAKIIDENKPCIIVVNKWDLILASGIKEAQQKELERRKNKDRDDKVRRPATLEEFAKWVQEQLFFMDYAPVIFTSATSGLNLSKLLESVRYVAAQLQQKIPTSLLNRTLRDAIERRQPVNVAGHFVKFFYATQVRQAPPTFILFVNRDELLTEAYRRYLAKSIRTAFGYEGCPIILVSKPRPKTVESVRIHQAQAKKRIAHKGFKPFRDRKERKPRAGQRPNKPSRPGRPNNRG